MIARKHRFPQNKKAGYVLLATTLGLVALMGMAGVAVDIGRITEPLNMSGLKKGH